MGFAWIMIFIPGIWVADDSTWQWPIDTRYGVSATFGEFRGGHFHMGLDFSTNGKEGMPVFPAKLGSVQKVRAQRHGYGRVVYLSHRDGKISVYGHLAAFGEKINAALEARGIQPDGFFGTAFLSVELLPTDILGHSGESGGGLPHLHFELRDKQNAPFDPLSLSFPPIFADFPVKFQGVRLLPLSDDARVNSGRVAVFLPADQLRCQAQGKMGIEIVAHLETARGNRLGISGLRVFNSGKMIGQWRPEKISFDNYRRTGTVFDQARSGFSPTQYVYAFDQRHEILGLVEGINPANNLLVSEATRVEIDVRDLSGRWHTFSLDLDPNEPRRELGDLGEFSAIQRTTLQLTPWMGGIQARGTMAGTLILPNEIVGLAPGQDRFFEVGKPGVPQTWVWRTKNGAIKRSIARLPDRGAFRLLLGDFEILTQEESLSGPQVALLLPPNHRVMSDTL